jgi:hypothetical protein
VGHPFAVAGFAQKARDRRAVLAQLFAQHFDRNGSMIRVSCAENGRGSTFADFALE